MVNRRQHCTKSVQIRSFFWSVFSRIQSECGKIRTRKNSYLDSFHAVRLSQMFLKQASLKTPVKEFICGKFTKTKLHYSHFPRILLQLKKSTCFMNSKFRSIRSTSPEVFLQKNVSKLFHKLTREHRCRSMNLVKMNWNTFAGLLLEQIFSRNTA